MYKHGRAIFFYEILKSDLELLQGYYPEQDFVIASSISDLPTSADGLYVIFSTYGPVFMPLEHNINISQINSEQAFDLVHSEKYDHSNNIWAKRVNIISYG